MKIGELAGSANFSIEAIRFYEKKGLLPVPARRASGYRDYSASSIDRLRFAKELQQLGFKLDEIVELLSDVDRGAATCKSERHRFEAVLARIDQKLAELHA